MSPETLRAFDEAGAQVVGDRVAASIGKVREIDSDQGQCRYIVFQDLWTLIAGEPHADVLAGG